MDNSPIPDCNGIPQDEWKGILTEARHEHGGKFADVFVSATNSATSIDGESRLGDCNFGIVIHRVVNGDPSLKDTTVSWPTHLLFYKGVSVHDHLRKHAIKVKEQELQNLQRKGRRKYKSNRPCKVKKTKEWKIGDEEIHNLYAGDCCY